MKIIVVYLVQVFHYQFFIDINNEKIKNMFNHDREIDRIRRKRKARDDGSRHVAKEKYFLSYYETAIITRLRSEHIDLNL